MKNLSNENNNDDAAREAGQMIDELVELEAVWIGDREKATTSLSDEERWGTGIKAESAFWREVEAIVESHGFSCEVDDSDGSPYLAIFVAIDPETKKS